MLVKINAHSLPRYQTWGVMGIIVLLLATIFAFLISHEYLSDEERSQQVREQIEERNKARLQSEMDAALDYLRFKQQQAETVLMQRSKEEVDKAYQAAMSLYQQSQGTLPDSAIRPLIVEMLRNVRFFDGRGYFFIDDMQGKCILLPTAPSLEGQSLWDNQDDTGHYIMRGLIAAVQNDAGEGFSRYRWFAPGDKVQMKDKIAYVRHFAPFDWIIGAGDYIYRIENDLKAEALARLSALRFGRNGYIAVLDMAGNVLFTPQSRQGDLPVHVDQLEDIHEQRVVKHLLNTAANGGGFTEYRWFAPDNHQTLERKLSLVSVMPEWNWVLVAGIYPQEYERIFQEQYRSLQSDMQKDVWNLLFTLVGLASFVLLLAWGYGTWLKKLFLQYQQDIEMKQVQLTNNAAQLKVAASVFETANEGIMITDPENRIVAVNQSFTDITGYQLEDVQGKDPRLLSSGVHPKEFYRKMWSTLAAADAWHGEIHNRTKAGESYIEQLSIAVSRGEKGEVINYIATFSDVTEKKHNEARLRYLAEYDDLTGLPNRRLLVDRVRQTIARAKRDEMRRFSLMFLDLDRFKGINDSLGHGVGDMVLQEVAQRLQGAVREVDTVSRIGGDEFVILISGKKDEAVTSAATLAQRLLKLVAEPIHEQGMELIVTPSIGIATYPDDGENFELLLRNADAALYHAKGEGRNNYKFYSKEMNERASARLQIESGLRQALERKAFELHYQPQYCLQTKRIVGCEALVRWPTEEGYISPAVFIEIAEETGMIFGIGEWVLREACRQGAEWLAQGYTLDSLAVNVSAVQFRPEFLPLLQAILQETGFPAALLEIEITESALMRDVEVAERVLQDLRALGVQVALDDFGTGYSSLAYLKRFPLNKLKIDRAFIDGLPQDKEDKAIVASILDVARHLGLQTIAEGAETREQVDFLEAYGCNFVQGFYFSKALPAPDFEALISLANPRT